MDSRFQILSKGHIKQKLSSRGKDYSKKSESGFHRFKPMVDDFELLIRADDGTTRIRDVYVEGDDDNFFLRFGAYPSGWRIRAGSGQHTRRVAADQDRLVYSVQGICWRGGLQQRIGRGGTDL